VAIEYLELRDKRSDLNRGHPDRAA
jgi:hypothetical protein